MLRYMSSQVLTDQRLQLTDWPVIFDQNTFPKNDKESIVEARQRLYDSDIFGLNQWDPADRLCARCKQQRDNCIGHFALMKLSENFRYILPPHYQESMRWFRKKTNKKMRRSEDNSAQMHYDAVQYMRSQMPREKFETITSIYIVVLPLASRFDYMNETRFSQRSYCSFHNILTTLCNSKETAPIEFLSTWERITTAKRKNGSVAGVWDLSQKRNYKRLTIKPSFAETMSKKNGFIRSNCIGGRVNISTRQVAIPNSSLEFDEVGVDPDLYESLNGSTIISCRYPSLYCTNLMRLKMKPILPTGTKVNAYPPEMCVASHLDFDGDETCLYGSGQNWIKDEIFHTPQSFARNDFGYSLFEGSYNAICCVYMLSTWPERRIDPKIGDLLVDILKRRRAARSERFSTRGQLLCFIVYLLMGNKKISITDMLQNGELIRPYRSWGRGQFRAIEDISKQIRKGDESQYLYDFRTCTNLMDTFVYYHSCELTISCENFAKAHERAKKDLETFTLDNFETLQSRSLSWFDPTDGEAIIVGSKCKGTLMHLVQGLCALGPVPVHYFINDFQRLCNLLKIPVKRWTNKFATAYINKSYYEGLTPQEQYIAAISGREGPVTSIVNTPDAGYGRRKAANSALGLVPNYLCCIQNGGSDFNQWFPPIFNVTQYDKHLYLNIAALLGADIQLQVVQESTPYACLNIEFPDCTIVRLESGHLVKFDK